MQIIIYVIYKRKIPIFGEKVRDTSTIDIENTSDGKESTTIKGDEDAQNMTKEQPVKIESKFDN